MIFFTYLFYFMLWTFMLYWLHRLAHSRVSVLTHYHRQHHGFIAQNQPRWHWSNLLLYQDNWPSTIDVWLTEVVPTLLFCWLFDCWFIMIAFYLWSALVQEQIEHNREFNLFPFITSGKWHLVHHAKGRYNFGIFHPIWDLVFGTYRSVTHSSHDAA